MTVVFRGDVVKCPGCSGQVHYDFGPWSSESYTGHRQVCKKVSVIEMFGDGELHIYQCPFCKEVLGAREVNGTEPHYIIDDLWGGDGKNEYEKPYDFEIIRGMNTSRRAMKNEELRKE